MSEGLHLDGVTLSVGGRVLTDRLDLSIPAGAVGTVIGPSGSGKSSLIAFAGGFLDPAFAVSGRVLVGGTDVTALPPQQRRIGTLFQDDLLFPHLSVGDNLAFGLTGRVRGRAQRQTAVEAALHTAGLSGFADRDPATLSGGQRARIALMRVLLSEPRALLLDEPFSKLDTELRTAFRAFVFGHTRSRGLPVLLASHDPSDLEQAGGPVLRLG